MTLIFKRVNTPLSVYIGSVKSSCTSDCHTYAKDALCAMLTDAPSPLIIRLSTAGTEREIHKHPFVKVMNVLKSRNAASCGTDLDISHKCLLWEETEGGYSEEKRARRRERCEGKMKMGECVLYHSV